MAELYQLRVVLRDVSPLVWRRLLISSETSLAQLREILLRALAWSGEHQRDEIARGVVLSRFRQ